MSDRFVTGDVDAARMTTSVPAGITATIDHIHRIDALDALVHAVGCRTWDLEEAMQLLEYLREVGVEPGRAITAAGYSPQRLHHFHKHTARRDGLDGRRWAPEDGTPTVYLLLASTEVVYVGCTEHAVERVAAHRLSGRPFDDAHYFTQPTLRDARDLEAVLIDQHRPVGNKRVEKRPT